jgi:hypothetical protein
MQSKTAKLINEERVIALLQCYGADTDHWPEEERAAAIALINGSSALQQRQSETRQLDEFMGMHEARGSLNSRADAAIVANIVNALPEQQASITVSLRDHRVAHAGTHMDKKTAKQRNSWWTYGAAAAVVLLAVSVVIQQSSQPLQPSQSTSLRTAAVSETASQEEMDQWMWQQATGLSEDVPADLSQDDADLPITFMAMVELDLLPNDE